MHTARIHFSLCNVVVCDSNSVKQIMNQTSFKKNAEEFGGQGVGGGEKSGQFTDKAELSQLYLCSKGHSSGQQRKALSAGALEVEA